MIGVEGVAMRAVLRVMGPPMERNEDRLRAAVRGKTVLITGASYGQGEATARLLAAAGATVLIAARTRDRLAGIAAEITDAGGQAHAYPVDLSDMDSVDGFARRVLAEHGRVDILIHNAGKSLRRSIFRSAVRRRDMDAMVGVNFLGPMRLTLALLPSMKECGGGQIINIATAGLWMAPAAPRWSFYLGCKAGFDVWIRSVGLESASSGIDVTSIYAGHIKSRMVATRWVSMMPGHTPEQAARIVGYAIARRPVRLAPRFLGTVRIAGLICERPLGLVLRYVDRHSGETPASEAAFARASAGGDRALSSGSGGIA